MRMIATILLIALSCLVPHPVSVLAAPGVSAQACVVLEGETGRILYQKNIRSRLPMASTTKIMTALVALELGNPEDKVAISKAAANTEGSSMYLKAGEPMTLEELLYGLMLASGNDAAVAISEHFGGTDTFVAKMNQKAQEIGATNTCFANPNGLPHDSHYSTAEDMATITACALKNPKFAEIVATRTRRIEGEGKAYPRVLTNHNKLLALCDGCIGVKTGFTKAAGRCLVSATRRNDMTLICVTLNAPDDWNDHQTLYNHLFATYTMTPVLTADTPLGTLSVNGSDTEELSFGAAESFSYPLAQGETVTTTFTTDEVLAAPVGEHQPCGTVSLQLGNTSIKTVTLKTLGSAERVLIPNSVKAGLKENLKTIYRLWLSILCFPVVQP